MSRVANTEKTDNVEKCDLLGRVAPTMLAITRHPNGQCGEWNASSQAVLAADRRIKRVVDVVVSALLLLALAPVFLLVALIVAVAFGGPMLVWKQRPGIGGRPIRLYRFTTRHAPLDATGRRLRDQRDTSLGRFLRSSGLDKLPQLFSVLRGELSLVGPRALPPLEDMIGADLRTAAKPGLFTLVQACGGRLLAPEDASALDAWYVRHTSVRLDTVILTMGFVGLIRGQRRNERAVRRARIEMWGCDQIVSQRAHR